MQTFEALADILDSEDTCWGSGVSVNGTAMSQSAWHKVLYVGVHRNLVDLNLHSDPLRITMKCTGNMYCHQLEKSFYRLLLQLCQLIHILVLLIGF